jgi:uncharacterized protein (DUF1330 family)
VVSFVKSQGSTDWVVAYRKVRDQATVKEYAALLLPVLEKFGARMLVSPTSVVAAKESGLQQMTIVVEFDSYEVALAAYESDDHSKALAALGPGEERDFWIAEGCRAFSFSSIGGSIWTIYKSRTSLPE